MYHRVVNWEKSQRGPARDGKGRRGGNYRDSEVTECICADETVAMVVGVRRAEGDIDDGRVDEIGLRETQSHQSKAGEEGRPKFGEEGSKRRICKAMILLSVG